MRKYGTTWAVFFLLLILVVFVFSLTSIKRQDDPLTYWQLHNFIAGGKAEQIKKVVMTNGESIIQVVMIGSQHERSVVVPSEAKEALIKELNDAHVQLEVNEPDKSSFWFSMISSFFLPILLLVGFLFMFRSAQGGSQSASSKAYQTLADLCDRVELMETEISDLKKQLASTREASDSPGKGD